MQHLDQPHYRKEGNVFVLYKVDFSTEKEPGYSEHTTVAGGAGMEVGRFSSLSDLQTKSVELFNQQAIGADN